VSVFYEVINSHQYYHTYSDTTSWRPARIHFCILCQREQRDQGVWNTACFKKIDPISNNYI